MLARSSTNCLSLVSTGPSAGVRSASTCGTIREAIPAILCGDFNAEPDSDEIRFLSSLAVIDGHTAFYQDAWRVAGEGPGYTQDWRTNPVAAQMNVHRKRIDYVFVGDPYQRRGNAGRVVSALQCSESGTRTAFGHRRRVSSADRLGHG